MADYRYRAPDPTRKNRKSQMVRHTPGVILRTQCQNPPQIPREEVAGQNRKEQRSGRERPRRTWEPHGKGRWGGLFFLPSHLWQSAGPQTVRQPLCPQEPKRCCPQGTGSFLSTEHKAAGTLEVLLPPHRPQPTWWAPYCFRTHCVPLCCPGSFSPSVSHFTGTDTNVLHNPLRLQQPEGTSESRGPERSHSWHILGRLPTCERTAPNPRRAP